jgi:uncharacterized protein (TIGR02217 family)
VSSGLKTQTQLDELIAFFRARKGKAYGFRFKDWTDYKVTGQLIGTGDGAIKTFQLIKRYSSGGVVEVRTIAKPVAGTVHIYKDGVEQLSGWSIDVTTGIVTFTTAPAAGVAITADFELDVPVRFDTDHMAVTIELQAAPLAADPDRRAEKLRRLARPRPGLPIASPVTVAFLGTVPLKLSRISPDGFESLTP